MNAGPATKVPGLTDIHAHPAMNAFLWDRDLRRHYMNGRKFNPLASLSDFKMLERGNVRVLWSSLHIPEREYFDCPLIWMAGHVTAGGRALLKRSAWDCLLMMMAEMERQVARAGSRFEVVRTIAELDRVTAEGRTAIVHTVEGGHVLGAGLADEDLDGRLARLDKLADRGVASLTVAHLFPNDLAGHTDGIPDENKRIAFVCKLNPEVEPDVGLKEPLGEPVVRRMVQRRIVPDVSHCTRAAREQIYAIAGGEIPVVATHTGVTSLNNEDYNIGESDVKAIKESGGVVGVIFMPYWLKKSKPRKGLPAIWETMKQIHDWSGGSWDHVAIGTDFDGFTDPADDCANSSKLPKVEAMLRDHGLAESDINAVLGGNARRVLAEAWRSEPSGGPT